MFMPVAPSPSRGRHQVLLDTDRWNLWQVLGLFHLRWLLLNTCRRVQGSMTNAIRRWRLKSRTPQRRRRRVGRDVRRQELIGSDLWHSWESKEEGHPWRPKKTIRACT